jgi:hypothetical protein
VIFGEYGKGFALMAAAGTSAFLMFKLASKQLSTA